MATLSLISKLKPDGLDGNFNFVFYKKVDDGNQNKIHFNFSIVHFVYMHAEVLSEPIYIIKIN